MSTSPVSSITNDHSNILDPYHEICAKGRPGEGMSRRVIRCFSNAVQREGYNPYDWAAYVEKFEKINVSELMRGNLESPSDWGIRLANSIEKEALIWTCVCSWARDVRLNRMLEGRPILVDLARKNEDDTFEFYGMLDGMVIVDLGDEDQRCHSFVFDLEPWYHSDTIEKTLLLSPPSEALEFLEHYYDRVLEPQAGDIVAYGTSENLQHFGQIIDAGSSGKPQVTSKFGAGPVYIHDLNLVPPDYGNQCVFLRPKPPNYLIERSDFKTQALFNDLGEPYTLVEDTLKSRFIPYRPRKQPNFYIEQSNPNLQSLFMSLGEPFTLVSK